MSFELVLTSVPKGLKPGSRGFASVAFTEGMPANYVQVCESLSGYVHVFDPQDSKYTQNPVGYSHLITSTGGRTFSILSRIAAYGTDYTGRTNKLAHHLMLGDGERPSCGPAFAMNNGRIFFSEWKDPPRFLTADRLKPSDLASPGLRAVQWEKAYGDAGMAGVLAQAFLDAPDRPSFLIFQPGMDLLPLLAEAQALLPPKKYWDVTFSTYFTALPVGMNCAWRCCLRDSDALVTARRIPNALVIDLIERKIISGSLPANDSLALAARTGERPSQPESASSPQPRVEDLPIKATSAKEIARPNPRRITLKPDCTSTFRPIAPTMAKRKQYPTGIILVGVSLLILVAVGFSFIFKPSKGLNEVADNKTTSIETNQLAVFVPPPPLESREIAPASAPAINEPTVKPAPLEDNTFKSSEPVLPVEYKYIVGSSYLIDSAPDVIFWDSSGNEIQNAKKLPPSIEGTSYMPGSSMGAQKLARHNAAKGLSEVSQDVAFLQLDSTNKHVFLFVSKANIRCALEGQQNPYLIKFQPGSGGNIILNCIEKENSRITVKLKRRGEVFAASAKKEGEGVRLSIEDSDLGRWKVQVISPEEHLKNLEANKSKLDDSRKVNENAAKTWDAAFSNKMAAGKAQAKERAALQQMAIEQFKQYPQLVSAAVKSADVYLEQRTKDQFKTSWANFQDDGGVPSNISPKDQLDRVYDIAGEFKNVSTDISDALNRNAKQNDENVNELKNRIQRAGRSAGDMILPDEIQIYLDNSAIALMSKPYSIY